MKYIIEVFSVMLVLVFNLLLCVSMLGVSADVAAAKEFKAAMIAEIVEAGMSPGTAIISRPTEHTQVIASSFSIVSAPAFTASIIP